jgi:hypothetical protein
VQQYEALGHAVRAAYTYSGMADIAMETRDPGYQSAVRSLWDNMVNRKLYLTGGVGSVGSNEGFGPNYSLTNRGYCESCSSCGAIFLHWKMNLAYHDAKYADAYEDTIYNALLGSTDTEGKNFYYTNPLDETVPRTPWHQCPCCVGNIPRTLMMLPTWTYLKGDDGIYVNLRSYRNIGRIGSPRHVVLVPYSAIASARATRDPLDPGAEARPVVLLKLVGAETSALELALAAERDGSAAGTPLGRMSWSPSPVAFEAGETLAIEWRARPGREVMLFELSRRGVLVEQRRPGLHALPR